MKKILFMLYILWLCVPVFNIPAMTLGFILIGWGIDKDECLHAD